MALEGIERRLPGGKEIIVTSASVLCLGEEVMDFRSRMFFFGGGGEREFSLLNATKFCGRLSCSSNGSGLLRTKVTSNSSGFASVSGEWLELSA